MCSPFGRKLNGIKEGFSLWDVGREEGDSPVATVFVEQAFQPAYMVCVIRQI